MKTAAQIRNKQNELRTHFAIIAMSAAANTREKVTEEIFRLCENDYELNKYDFLNPVFCSNEWEKQICIEQFKSLFELAGFEITYSDETGFTIKW